MPGLESTLLKKALNVCMEQGIAHLVQYSNIQNQFLQKPLFLYFMNAFWIL